MYKATFKVTFGEVDYAGIVYYPNFFDYFQRTEEEFMEHLGFPYQKLLGQMKIGFPIVGVKADFKRPVRYADILDIVLKVERLGNSSVTFSFQVFKKSPGSESPELCAQAMITHATIDLLKFKPIAIPAELRALFEALLDAEH